MDASPFKTPSSTPQDLLLIQDLIGDFLPPPPPKAPPRAVVAPVDSDSDIASTSSEDEDEDDDSDEGESETEVSKDLLDLTNDEGSGSAPSPSDSEPASDSDDDEIPSLATKKAQPLDDDGDDEDETGTSLAPGAVPQTKNELPDVEINIPDVEEVGPDELLEKVGEIMSILDERVVIVKGKESSIANRGAESALDSDTLLIFDDRKTLGYIYETFGPTSQPFYQVKFNQKYPLDVSKVQLGREVFHVPTRSRFVFLRDIQYLKGSDASNLYDEEPAEHELEYSDDEAEAAAKSRRKRTRGESRSRAGSVSSSRFSTPGPSQMRDQEMNYMNGDAYAAHGPYDIDFTGTSSRPPPMPYDDDPYADIPTATPNDDSPSSPPKPSPNDSRYPEPSMSRGMGRGRPRPPPRGRGRGRGQGDFSRRGRNDSRPPRLEHSPTSPTSPDSPMHGAAFTVPINHQQPYNGNSFPPFSPDPSMAWNFHQPYNPSEPNPQAFVQPHINPRFASMLSANAGFTPQLPFMGYGASMGPMNVRDRRDQAPSDWTDEWTVYGGSNGNIR